MKNFILIAFITFLSLSFLAWKKFEKPSNPSPISVSATINGTQWTPTSTTATLTIDSTMPGRKFQLIAESADKIIKLAWKDDAINSVISNGNHDIGGSHSDAEFVYTLFDSGNAFTEQVPISMQFNITSVDNTTKKVSGTFNSVSYKYETTDTLKITNGVFTNVPFSVVYQ